MIFRRGLLSAVILSASLPTFAAEPAQPVAAPVTATAPAAAADDARLPLNDLRNFVEVMTRIRESYVEPVDDKTLFENAIRGMLTALDPHSSYLVAKDFEDLKSATSGEFGGLGLEVGMEDGIVRVVSPIDDTPAQKAGIQAGDYILKIDDKVVKGMSLNEAVNLMRGKPDTKVRLTIMRPNQEPRDLEITRAKIEVTSIRSLELEPGFSVIRISQFQMHTGRDLKREIEKVKAKGELKGLVLDLRNNPGGVLNGAIEVSDVFMESGVVVSTRSRDKDNEQKFFASPGDLTNQLPLVVLVNGGSASASEIVAGALQDSKRALVVGTTTFGKGSVQSVLPIATDKAIKLTTARYYTPNGRSIQAEGIKPDVIIEQAKLTPLVGGQSIREADLKGHLENGATATSNTAKTEAAKEELKLEERDYQMYSALNILKGLSFSIKPAAPSAAPAVADKK